MTSSIYQRIRNKLAVRVQRKIAFQAVVGVRKLLQTQKIAGDAKEALRRL
jgi:hypothetical protein